MSAHLRARAAAGCPKVRAAAEIAERLVDLLADAAAEGTVSGDDRDSLIAAFATSGERYLEEQAQIQQVTMEVLGGRTLAAIERSRPASGIIRGDQIGAER